MKKVFVLALLALAGCSGPQVKQNAAQVAQTAEQIKAACANAAPLASAALAIPTIGPFVAAGVTALCASDAAIAKAAEDPSTVAWLAQQSDYLKRALGK